MFENDFFFGSAISENGEEENKAVICNKRQRENFDLRERGKNSQIVNDIYSCIYSEEYCALLNQGLPKIYRPNTGTNKYNFITIDS